MGRQKVAIVTGASQGIGAGLATAFRAPVTRSSPRRARSGHPTSAGLVTVQGDIAEAETAERVVERALDRFGRSTA